MTKRNKRKFGISRRLGVSLWGQAKDPVHKRNMPPGQHGTLGYRKLTDYGVQLQAKQKLKRYYGDITEKQFRRIYDEAVRRKGDTSENMIGLLESRLDAMIYRAGLAPTIFAARQIVNHGHILVDGKRVNIPSYRVKPNQKISVRERSRDMALIQDSLKDMGGTAPDYLEFDAHHLSLTYKRLPSLAEVPYPVKMEPNLVIEYYSR